MEQNEEKLDLINIRKSFYLTDNEKREFDLSDNAKINIALQLRSKRGSRKEALNNIKKDSRRILLLNDRFKPFFVNFELKNGRIEYISDIQPFLAEFVEKYPIIVEGYALNDNSLQKCTISTGNDFEKLQPAIIVRNHYTDSSAQISRMKDNIASIQKNAKVLEERGIDIGILMNYGEYYSEKGKKVK